MFLYGIALVYGATGTTNLTGIADFLAANDAAARRRAARRASRSCSSGSASRSRPRRSTCGRPTCTRARPRRSPRSWPSATKAAAFAAFLRIFVGAFPLYSVDWRPTVWGLAVLSLLVGSVAAIVQTDVKRMLAYSSISHAGFVLIAVQAATREGHERRAVLRARLRGHDDRRVRA